MNIGSLGPPLQGLETVGSTRSPNAKLATESPPGDFGSALKQQQTGSQTTEKSGKGLNKTKPQAADPILEFMDSIESELGIEPTRLVGAMGKLNEQELLSAPEDSVEPLVDELGLLGTEEEFFKSKYLEMAKQWQQSPAEGNSSGMESYPQAMAAVAATRQGAASVEEQAFIGQSAGQQKTAGKPAQIFGENSHSPREELNSSIDRMNQKFFMKGDYSKSNKPQRAALEDLSPAEIMGEGYPLASPRLAKTDLPPMEGLQDAATIPQQSPKVPGKSSTAIGAMGLLGKEAPMGIETPLAQPLTNGGEGQSFGMPTGAQPASSEMISKLQSEGLNQDSFSMDGLDLTKPMESGNQQASSGFSESFSSEGGEGFDSETSEEGLPQMFNGQEALGSADKANAPQRPMGAIGGTTAAGLQQAVGEDHAAQNVSNMIEQARFIAKDGGGDMQVRLTPEGMGQVDLKVTVENGVINVEMMADTAEARELLERHKDDLRVGLSEQNLPIKEIKIGSGPQSFAQDDFSQSNQDREQSQELAKQFMEQFRHQNHRSRSGAFEIPGIKGYKKATTYADGLAPLQNSPRNNKAEGGHIYVVA